MTAPQPTADTYPNDDVTRTLVAHALAVATLLEFTSSREPSLTEKKLMAAAERWKQTHGRKRT